MGNLHGRMPTKGFLKDVETKLEAGFSIPKYDYIALTYVASGNGTGEIETATYKNGGASGETVAILTITYNSDNEIATVTRT